jgi:hypothetical protein
MGSVVMTINIGHLGEEVTAEEAPWSVLVQLCRSVTVGK